MSLPEVVTVCCSSHLVWYVACCEVRDIAAGKWSGGGGREYFRYLTTLGDVMGIGA